MDASKEKHMPIIIGIFCALPFLAGLIAEYLVCRLRWLWGGPEFGSPTSLR